MKKIGFVLAATFASVMSTGAMAQAYVGGAIGTGHVTVDCSGATSCDKTDTAYKGFGGYHNDNWALEFGYINFGKLKASSGAQQGEIKTEAALLSVGFQDQIFGDWGYTIHVGLASTKAKSVAAGFADRSETNIEPYLGLGLSYNLNKNVMLEAGGDFTRAELGGEKYDARALTVGLRYGF